MHISLIKRAAVICASALAFASTAANAQDWTSFKIGELANYSFSHTHLPDGRFLFGTEGKVFVQDAFGSASKTQVANSDGILLDPSFVAARSGNQALVGGGGFMGPSGVYLFNPDTPGTTLVTPPLATLQNYNAVFWKHPTSGREGWLIGGANAGLSSNLTFVSTDGLAVGSVTSALSAYSGGLAVDQAGNIFVSLSGPDAATNNKVVKYTAAQIDTAVQAVLAGTPAPLAVDAAASVFLADASGALAVDASGRLWITGYQINHLQAYDPASGASRRFIPDHPALANAFGPPAYAAKVFTKDATEYVSFLVNDSYYTTTSDILLGYRPSSELIVRSATIATESGTISEAGGTVSVTVTLTPAAAEQITVPVSISGSATAGSDFTATVTNVVFDAGQTSKTFDITIIDDAVKGEGNETVIATLGTPTPAAQVGLGALGTETFSLTIEDNDPMPVIGFTSAGSTVNEAAGTVNVAVSVNPTVTETVTVPVTVTGTATSGQDYTTVTGLVIAPGDTTKNLAIQVINDTTAQEADETVIVTLGAPTPVGQALLGLPATHQYVLQIQDNDVKARIATEQNFGTLRVGASFAKGITTLGGTATKWSAKGLPPGLKMNADGTITGVPTAAGEYDQVIITTTNAFGVSTSVAFLLNVEAFPAGAVGTFSGLIARTGSATDGQGALVTLTSTSKASYTGKVLIGKKSYAIKGNLDAASTNPTGFADLKNGTVTQRLEFALNSTSGALTGNLPGGALLAGWRAQTATDRTGIYNFLAAVPGEPSASIPQGASFGSLKLSAKAVASVTGQAADGSKFTSSNPLSVNGDVIIYQSLYTAPGTFSGKVTLANDLAHSITGALTWNKPEQAKGPLYKDGWEVISLTARGGKYRPAAGATLPLDADEYTGNNARLSLQDGGIELVGNTSNPKTFPLQIVSATKVVIAAPQKLTLINATGAFSGSITVGEGAAKKVIPFQGLLVPDASTENAFDSEGFGYFILPTTTAGESRAGAVFFERLTDA